MWFYVSIVLQIIFGIHAVKTKRPFVWVLVIIIFPVFGVGGYIIIELLPEWWASRSGQQVKSAIGKKVDPENDLKAALNAYKKVDTVQNRTNLAEQYMKLQRYNEARELYARCLAGTHAEDPQIMLSMARAEFGLRNAEAVIAMLDKLKETNPTFKSPEGHLLFARALENAGRLPEAIHEYETLGGYYPTPEPACRLAQIYQAQGNNAKADELFQSVIKRSATAGKLFNETHKEWIKLAKQEVGGK
jgi:hypothetical protein